MSLRILENVDLKNYSTFKIGGRAEFFAVIEEKEDLLDAISWAKDRAKKIFVLGGGSNVLFPDDFFPGLVLKNEIKGIDIVGERGDDVIVRSYSGEGWSKLVNFSIEKGLYGIENTFYIHGTVGAAPVQNIGAYGVEIKDSFHELCAIDLNSGKEVFFSKKDCNFSYRDSIFKREAKDKYFILWVDLVLSRNDSLNLNYPDIYREMASRGIKSPSLKELTDIIREIRDRKLPNPAITANAGSFFKNPFVSLEFLEKLKEKFPDIRFFLENGQAKISAAWMIDNCGLKGKRVGSAGVYEKHALILVNHGQAKQKDILELANIIKEKVKEKFDIELEPEVNIL
jgi:UDP-N-acetylmuramate dehydrogenase